LHAKPVKDERRVPGAAASIEHARVRRKEGERTREDLAEAVPQALVDDAFLRPVVQLGRPRVEEAIRLDRVEVDCVGAFGLHLSTILTKKAVSPLLGAVAMA